jgi:hypothetical protein
MNPKWVKFAFHNLLYWELTGQWSMMSNETVAYTPQPADLAAQRYFQNTIWLFLENGIPGNGWVPFNANSGWPSVYAINVIKNSSASGVFLDYRKNVCDFYNLIGLSRQEFWWAN